MATDVSKMPELLAPAGGPDELAAALAAGADAVYFGLKKLNARTGAKNFPPEALQTVVQSIHDAHAKAYLTLNVDLAQSARRPPSRHPPASKQRNPSASRGSFWRGSCRRKK